jgi:hypothetical protein
MTLAYTNGALTSVHGSGTTRQYGRAAVAGAEKWTGEERIVVDQELVSDIAGERVNQVSITRLLVPAEPGETIAREDTVTFQRDAADNPEARRVREIESSDPLGLVRLTLWDE